MRARLVVLLSALFLAACAGKDPVSSRDASVEPAAKLTVSNAVAATCEKCVDAELGGLAAGPVPASALPITRIVTTGSRDVELLKFKLLAPRASADYTRFKIASTILAGENGAAYSGARPLSSLKNYRLFGGALQFGPTLSTFSMETRDPWGGELDFNLGTFNAYHVGAGTETDVTLKATVNDWPFISSGSVHQFSLQLPTGNEEIVGNPVVVRRAYPIVRFLPLPSNVLAGGATSQATIAKFSVESVNGQTRYKKFTFRVQMSDATPTDALELDNLRLYRNGALLDQSEYVIFDGAGTSPEHELGPSGSRALSGAGTYDIAVVFSHPEGWVAGGEEAIDASAANTYELKDDVANAHIGSSTDADAIITTMLGDDGASVVTSALELHPTGAVTVGAGGSSANFIWSDYSAELGLHSSSVPSPLSPDWTNGFLVPASEDQRNTLPLGPWVLSK